MLYVYYVWLRFLEVITAIWYIINRIKKTNAILSYTKYQLSSSRAKLYVLVIANIL